MESSFNVTVFAVVLGGWIFSLCLHEFSHALVAYLGGDRSVKEKGYLTFNPFLYTEPFASLLLPLLFLMLGGIGLPGGAVYIDTRRLRSRHWDCAVSLAGPLSNILLLGVLVLPFQLGLVTVDPFAAGLFWLGYAYLCHLQVMAALLNLLPIPPLDGFQAIAAYLSPSTRVWCNANGNLFFLGFIVVLWRVDAVASLFWTTVYRVSGAVGIPLDLVVEARGMLRIF